MIAHGASDAVPAAPSPPPAPIISLRQGVGVGVYDGLSTLIAARHRFDFLWISSYSVSASLGLPDAGLVDPEIRLRTVRLMRSLVPCPLVVDMDAAADDPVKTFREVRELVSAGAAAVCIEDVVQRKRSSLYDTHPRQLAPLEQHALRICAAAAAFRAEGAPAGVISRTEALVTKDGIDEALSRSEAALRAGADAVFVQSLDASGEEVTRFCEAWERRSAVFLAPTRFGGVTRQHLFTSGASHVIFANQAIRAAHRAVDAVFERMRHVSHCDVDEEISTVKDVADEVGADALLELESRLVGNGKGALMPRYDAASFLRESQQYLERSRDQWSLDHDVDMETFNHLVRVWLQLGEADRHIDDLRRLVAIQHDDGGWGDRRDDLRSRGRTSAFSTQMLLRARRALPSPEFDAAVERGLDFLVERQQPDGRWIDDRWHFLDATSVSVGTLIFAVGEPNVSDRRLAARREALERGMSLVLDHRASDGLWYHKVTASPVEITAHLLQKCVLYRTDEVVIHDAVRGLLELQDPTGSWDADNTDSTCDVVRCLMLVSEHDAGASLESDIDGACERAMAWLLDTASEGSIGVRPGRTPSVLYTCDLIDTALKYLAHEQRRGTLAGFYR